MSDAPIDVAETILAQLGGQRFIAMTGAREFLGDAKVLQFKLPRGAKDGCNAVRIELDASDTYTVTFYKVGRAPTYKLTTLASVEHVYSDSLRRVFESHTGLYTSL